MCGIHRHRSQNSPTGVELGDAHKATSNCPLQAPSSPFFTSLHAHFQGMRHMSRERRAGGVSCQGFIATAFLLALLPSPSRATFGLTSRRTASPPPPPPLPATPPTPLAPITHASSLSRKGKDDDDDKSPSLIEDILRRLRGDFSHPLSDSTRLVVHYDCRDYRSGLRGLGLRHVWRDVGQTFLEEEGEEEEGMEGVGRGGRKAGWKAWVFPWEIRGGMSVKRIHGVGIPQFWRMGRVSARSLGG